MADHVVLEESKATNEKYEVVHQKPETFYGEYERKSDLKHQTHYCPGCGHGVAHKLIAEALEDLKLQDQTILVSPVVTKPRFLHVAQILAFRDRPLAESLVFDGFQQIAFATGFNAGSNEITHESPGNV